MSAYKSKYPVVVNSNYVGTEFPTKGGRLKVLQVRKAKDRKGQPTKTSEYIAVCELNGVKKTVPYNRISTAIHAYSDEPKKQKAYLNRLWIEGIGVGGKLSNGDAGPQQNLPLKVPKSLQGLGNLNKDDKALANLIANPGTPLGSGPDYLATVEAEFGSTSMPQHVDSMLEFIDMLNVDNDQRAIWNSLSGRLLVKS